MQFIPYYMENVISANQNSGTLCMNKYSLQHILKDTIINDIIRNNKVISNIEEGYEL